MRLALALAVVVAVPPVASAQPVEDDDVPAMPAEPPPETGQPIQTLQRDYDEAWSALLAGDTATAIAGFDRVAAAATGDLAAGARELGRFARQIQARRIRFIVATPPTETPAAIAEAVPEDDRQNSGRVGFVASSTIAGLYAGLAMLDIADVDDFRAGTLMVVGTTGTAFAASLLATRDSDISSGMADAYSTGLLLGAGNGLLLSSPLGLDSSEQVLGVGLAGMVLGGGLGLAVADRARPTVGQSSFVSTMSALGIASTGLGLVVIGDDDMSEDTILSLLAGGLDAGAVTGILVSPRLEWSKGRARLVQLGSLLGGLAGIGIAAIITGEPEDDAEARLLAASALGGLWGGFGLTIRLTQDMKPDPRFAGADQVALMPTLIGRAPGLVAGGRF